MLAKGLVPLALAVPLALRFRWIRDLLQVRAWCSRLLVIALPWYMLCYAAEWASYSSTSSLFGITWSVSPPERTATYAALVVLPASDCPPCMLPWMSAAAAHDSARKSWYRRPAPPLPAVVGPLRTRAVFGFRRINCPGYVLPLLPAAGGARGLGAGRFGRRSNLVGSPRAPGLLIAFPIAAPLLPAAVANEWSAAPHARLRLDLVDAARSAGGVCGFWKRAASGLAAVLVVTAATAIGLTYLKVRCEPEMERIATAPRPRAAGRRSSGQTCASARCKRDQEYGLEYYLGTLLPSLRS